MLSFKNIPLRRKQTLIIMLTSGVVLLLACAAFAIYDAITFRGELTERVSILADAVGNNCAAAIDFNDPKTAVETLAALRADNNIVSACVYSYDGKVFAVYQRDGAASFLPPTVQSAGQEFTNDELHLFRPIKQKGVTSGTIFVASDLEDLSLRLRNYVVIGGVVFLTSLLVALLLSSRLQRHVSNPILHLSRVARTVARDKNYSLRAEKHSNDEIGQLVDGFNEMLAQIQQRDAALHTAHDELEARVIERTTELAKTNEALQKENIERKRAEATLRESEERFSDAFEYAPIGIALALPDGRFLKVNRALCEMLGYSEAELLARTFHDITYPEDAEVSRENVSRVLSGDNRSFQMEKRYIHARGHIVSALLSISLVRSAQGQPSYLIGQIQDITERKKAEEALRESGAEFRALAEAMPQMVWITRADGWNIYFSQQWMDYTGLTLEESLGHGWNKPFHPEDRQRAWDAWQLATTTTGTYSVECRLRRADGVYRWWLIRGIPQKDAGGNILKWFGTCTDIHDLKLAEESLRLLNSAVVQSKESIVITDAELDLPGPKIIFVNPAFTKMTGYTAEEAIGKTPRILQGPHSDRAVLHRLRETLGRGDVFQGETINYRKDGTEFNLEWQIAPIRNASGKITHFVAIQRDITDRKRLEAQLFQSQKLETVGKLSGGIAHEFNSILTAIIGQSELLLGDLPTGSPLVKNATEISNAAGRAAVLTRQLLAYGRKQILDPEILDLNSVLAGMESTLRHLVGQDTDVRLAPAMGLKAVKADAGQIEQVIMNIAMNAADAMPHGGKLTLETANVTLDEEYVSRFAELKAGDYVMLAITDTGAGMSEAVKARIFEPFFTTKGVGQGTGLGLSTCYGIIKQSGGHIAVYSELGRGATFKIYLPQAEQEAKIPVQRLDAPDLPRGTETILLVEDDPALREMAATLLRRLGYTVLAAANGVEALVLKKQPDIGHIDLLFTDVVMPHMSGRELADRVQALYPLTRILFTSAYTESAIVHQGVLNKGVSLLQKPFTPSALAHKVRQVLDEPSASKLEPIVNV